MESLLSFFFAFFRRQIFLKLYNVLKNHRHIIIMIACSISLFVLGMINIKAVSMNSDIHYIVNRQLYTFCLGVLILIGLLRINIAKFLIINKWQIYFLGILLISLPLFQNNPKALIAGADRYVALGDTIFYFNYTALLLVLPLVAHSVKRLENTNAIYTDFFLLLGIVALPSMLFLMQPDVKLSLLFDMILILLFLRNRNRLLIKLSIIFLLLIPIVSAFIIYPYNLNRITEPYFYKEHIETSGFQTYIALQDIQSGGLLGMGLNNLDELKISPIITLSQPFTLQFTGRQFGLFGLLLAIGLFIAFTYAGFSTLKKQRYNNEMYLISFCMLCFLSISMFNGFGRVLNIAPGLLPVPIAFMSYFYGVDISAFIALAILYSAYRLSCLTVEPLGPRDGPC